MKISRVCSEKYGTGVPVSRQNFGSAKSVTSLLSDIDKIHLDDKVAGTLNRLDVGDFLVISPNMEETVPAVKRLASIFTDAILSVYHITNKKFNDILVFTKSKPNQTEFININYDPVRLNTFDVKPFCGYPVKDGDRVWGKTLRSVLIKDKPDIPKELEGYAMMFANQYSPEEIYNINQAVKYRPPHKLRN